jgi:hypothetical protein
MVAQGKMREIPQVAFDPAAMSMRVVRTDRVNEAGVSIWLPGARDPFAAAYENGLKEDYFTHVNGRRADLDSDFMGPFFHRVTETIRAIRPDWLVFAELDPFKIFQGAHFPEGTPPGMVNASHWYDIITLSTKTFMFPVAFNPYNGKTMEGADAIRNHYVHQLGRIKRMGDALPNGGAPTLIGECGIPYDLDHGAAYKAFAAGDHSQAPWEKHTMALRLMYDAMDELLLHSTQWNYTASNRNDLAIGDGWNQEDLSIYSVDQDVNPNDPDSGGRAVAGFARPYVRVWAGDPVTQSFDSETGAFRAELTAAADMGDIEIYAPRRVYPGGPKIVLEGKAIARWDDTAQLVRISPQAAGALSLHLSPRTA